MKLKLALHDIHHRGSDIARALRAIIDEAGGAAYQSLALMVFMVMWESTVAKPGVSISLLVRKVS
jgi:hypothetical protein